MKSSATLILVSSRSSDSSRAIAAPQHRAGREPGHLTVSRPYGRPSHIAVTNTRLFTVRSHKVPVPRGHRAFTGKQEWR